MKIRCSPQSPWGYDDEPRTLPHIRDCVERASLHRREIEWRVNGAGPGRVAIQPDLVEDVRLLMKRKSAGHSELYLVTATGDQGPSVTVDCPFLAATIGTDVPPAVEYIVGSEILHLYLENCPNGREWVASRFPYYWDLVGYQYLEGVERGVYEQAGARRQEVRHE